jgi:hypothetical protein
MNQSEQDHVIKNLQSMLLLAKEEINDLKEKIKLIKKENNLV